MFKSIIFKNSIFLFISFILVSCNPPHHHRGASFITEPKLEFFGASLEKINGKISVKSYFQSSVIGRTEYIYENLNIELPENIKVGEKYELWTSHVKLWYAKGGQAGQINTEKAAGTIEITRVESSELELHCDLKFYGFSMKGHFPEVPNEIRRKGILTAKMGYRLY